jgi:hypothetical protein
MVLQAIGYVVHVRRLILDDYKIVAAGAILAYR